MGIPDLVSVVIPNWNGKRFLAGCFDSLGKQSYQSIEILLVDNGSNDDSVQFVQENYPQVKIIRFATNTGFSPAVNAGINASTGEFVVLMNNDTIADSNWVSEMVKAIKQHPEAGSCGCKMLAYDDHRILDGAGDGYRRGGLPGRIGHRELDRGQFDNPRYILGACGGAALYRRSLFNDIGLFDEDYFAYLEDVDMGLRAQNAGYKCIYVPTAIIYHLGCGTTGSGYSPLVVKLSARNNWNTIVKNIPGKLVWKFLPAILYWQFYYFAVVTYRGGQVLPYILGSLQSLYLLPKMLKKRSEIKAKRRVPVQYLEQIILESEHDLTESRARLIKQDQELASSLR